jgi:asparagine synthase (glutamine-hydrolysing)
VWAGYLGPGEEQRLTRLLGEGARIVTGPGFGLGVRETGGEPAILTVTEGGHVRAAIGDDVEAGCSATIDPAGPTAVLQRDLFGLHAVYTTRRGERLWFASNLRALLRCFDTAPALDPIALHGYLCCAYVPTPHTLFSGISVLPAGSRMQATPGKTEVEGAVPWRAQAPFAGSEEEAVAQLQTLLRTAVAHRRGAEREVGVFLSGGLDSSLIAALLAEAGAGLRLFTLDFGPPWNAELPYAHQVAAHLGQPLRGIAANPKAVRSALEATGAALEQPFGDGVVVPLMLLGQAASGCVETVFNGEGGDQLFGGWANKPMIAAELYGTTGYDREAAYLGTLHRFYGLTDRLYTPRMRTLTAGIDVGAWVRPALNEGEFASLLHRLRAANLALKGAQNIAPRSVQLAAAQGLKVRSPFFDRTLTEWSFGLPPEWLLRGACEKYLLKRVAEAYLPADIVWREKRGMGVPVTEWCLGPLRRDVARTLSPRRLKRDDLFDPRFVAALRRGEDLPGEFRRRRVGEKLWTLWMFQLWSTRLMRELQ